MAKTVKASELREMTAEALQVKVGELEAKLFNTKLQAVLGKLEDTSTLRMIRKDVARAQTVLAEKATKA